ncbi:hypothetical protein FB45DRAFT_1028591 [Roridomyces roridus]|uniref:Uncharacterized protein n=1 Tax=Roridomyces roridus TaxID=1738132 RepID=A0AAD7BR37_9AGAR|nr:hypothetical protein FB45DRAFT_1028591 [Roridomyces roridus]
MDAVSSFKRLETFCLQAIRDKLPQVASLVEISASAVKKALLKITPVLQHLSTSHEAQTNCEKLESLIGTLTTSAEEIQKMIEDAQVDGDDLAPLSFFFEDFATTKSALQTLKDSSPSTQHRRQVLGSVEAQLASSMETLRIVLYILQADSDVAPCNLGAITATAREQDVDIYGSLTAANKTWVEEGEAVPAGPGDIARKFVDWLVTFSETSIVQYIVDLLFPLFSTLFDTDNPVTSLPRDIISSCLEDFSRFKRVEAELSVWNRTTKRLCNILAPLATAGNTQASDLLEEAEGFLDDVETLEKALRYDNAAGIAESLHYTRLGFKLSQEKIQLTDLTLKFIESTRSSVPQSTAHDVVARDAEATNVLAAPDAEAPETVLDAEAHDAVLAAPDAEATDVLAAPDAEAPETVLDAEAPDAVLAAPDAVLAAPDAVLAAPDAVLAAPDAEATDVLAAPDAEAPETVLDVVLTTLDAEAHAILAAPDAEAPDVTTVDAEAHDAVLAAPGVAVSDAVVPNLPASRSGRSLVGSASGFLKKCKGILSKGKSVLVPNRGPRRAVTEKDSAAPRAPPGEEDVQGRTSAELIL